MEPMTGPLENQPLTTQKDVRLREVKRLEWIFIGIRWLWVVLLLVMLTLHHPASRLTTLVLTGILALSNIGGSLINSNIKTLRHQSILSTVMLSLDAVIASGVILQFVGDFNTAAYAVFAYIIAEAAIRFELIGSLSALAFFIVGLYGAYLYRKAVFDLPFSYTGFAYWTILMAVIAVSIGIVVRMIKNQRQQNERYLMEITRVLEQQRIAHEINVKNISDLENMEPLTVREKEVVNLIAQGKGNKEIAAELGIQVKTVKNYINNIYSKLQVKSRYEVISYLFKRPK
ncbi:MAG: response regulator transcription factor [Chloroflexi bacterium]|nr:response regulator transcription factor [Chloroflexota bacterium]